MFCGLDMMDNRYFLEKLKFTVSDKGLHYYLYNWMCPSMKPDKVLITAPYIITCQDTLQSCCEFNAQSNLDHFLAVT